jgi:hypothetical protein
MSSQQLEHAFFDDAHLSHHVRYAFVTHFCLQFWQFARFFKGLYLLYWNRHWTLARHRAHTPSHINRAMFASFFNSLSFNFTSRFRTNLTLFADLVKPAVDLPPGIIDTVGGMGVIGGGKLDLCRLSSVSNPK